ncbi:hypothetical protein V5O48_006168 [Marasmius crinis-equi]|uniref:F-box domain-containing protein n=1 Tax=Marasmius crinis-equi TaxID=585013 RepID=A0ABR3FKS9_9AGAR
MVLGKPRSHLSKHLASFNLRTFRIAVSKAPVIQLANSIKEIDRILLTDVANHLGSEILQLLKAKRNSLTLACQLPAEVLGEILAIYVALNRVPRIGSPDLESEKEDTPWPWSLRLLRILNVLRVYRYWRSVALNTPNVWSTPDFNFPRWALRMLRWSKSAPLHIDTSNVGRLASSPDDVLCPEEVLRSSTMKAIFEGLEETSRISSLRLEAGLLALEELIKSSGLIQPAPLLTSLIIKCGPDWFSSLRERLLVLPEDILTGSPPNLSSLQLLDCYIPWRSGLFMGNLTTLSIRYSQRYYRTWDFEDGVHPARLASPPPSQFQFQWYLSLRDLKTTIQNLLEVLPHNDIETLKLCMPKISGSETVVAQCFGWLPRLKVIILQDECAIELVRALGCCNLPRFVSQHPESAEEHSERTDFPEYTDEDSNPGVFPALRVLALTNVKNRRYWDDFDAAVVCPKLLEVLRARGDHDLHLRTLALVGLDDEKYSTSRFVSRLAKQCPWVRVERKYPDKDFEDLWFQP